MENPSTEELFQAYMQTKEISLRDQIMEKNLYIAQIIAKKFTGRGVEFDDLYQVACLALLKAIERFDITRGIKFSSFATPSIIGEIKNYFRDRTRMMRISRKDSEQLLKLNEARHELEQSLGYSPRPEQLAEKLDVSTERILELLETQRVSAMIPIDKLTNPDDDEKDLYAVIGKEDDSFSTIENADFINKSLSRLEEKERFLITERFLHNRTQKEVAAMLNVSQMYVSRYEGKILKKMREMYQE